MLYTNERKKWEYSGGTSGISIVGVYHHPVKRTYRIVGRKVKDHVCIYVVFNFNSGYFHSTTSVVYFFSGQFLISAKISMGHSTVFCLLRRGNLEALIVLYM